VAVDMGRKRDLVPHVEYGRAFLIKNSLEFLKSGNRLEYCPEGEWVDTVNRQVVPPLPVGWQRKVQACDGTLSSEHLATIERLVRRYTAERVARLDGAIEWKETIERTRRFANAYNALLGELNDWRAGYGLIWRRVEQISGIGGLKPLTHDEVYPIVSRLHSATSAAVVQMASDREAGGSLSEREPWNDLVLGLASLWRDTGRVPTASKSGRTEYAKPSAFAQLVWTVVTAAVPKPLRQYTGSQGAMQSATSNALRSGQQRVGMVSQKNRSG
jgi:hypothetical protein